MKVDLDPSLQAIPVLTVSALSRSPLHKHDDIPIPVGSSARSTTAHSRPHRETQRPLHTQNRQPTYDSRQTPKREGIVDQPIDPELTKRDPSSEPGYQEALRAWARFRFVRAGWFTAQEAMDYIE